jgi:death-on-curing protein
MKPVYLTREELLKIHRKVLTDCEEDTILTEGNLDYCVEVSKQEFFGEEIYKTIPEKAAAILCSIDKRHPFLHANKRAGFQACDVFLRMNGFQIEMQIDEAVDVSKKIAQCLMDIDQTSLLFKIRLKKVAKEYESTKAVS